jgi:hypothetical protein
VAVRLKSAATTAVAVPVSELVCGEPDALSLTVRVAESVPAAVGAKTMEIAQEVPAASELPQAFVEAKAVLLVPVTLMPVIASAAVPVFESVNIWAVRVLPEVTLPKFAVAGVRVAWGTAGPVAVPVRVDVCVPASSTMVRVAVNVPALLGVKIM